MSSTGVLAGSIEDMWQVAMTIAQRAGGDPGRAGECGPEFRDAFVTPAALRARCLIVIESADRRAADAATRTAFEALLDQMACLGVTLLRRRDHPAIAAFEQASVNADDDRALRLQHALARHAALAPLADAIVMLSAPGPALSALLHAPAVTLPLMAVTGMPVGALLVGQRKSDARVVSLARWVARDAGTVAV